MKSSGFVFLYVYVSVKSHNLLRVALLHGDGVEAVVLVSVGYKSIPIYSSISFIQTTSNIFLLFFHYKTVNASTVRDRRSLVLPLLSGNNQRRANSNKYHKRFRKVCPNLKCYYFLWHFSSRNFSFTIIGCKVKICIETK